ncbi:MAG: hypothetical protein QOI46_4641 [Alphaproteobacteria bacterium]|nr:hypothetical protein [Alphaproteobacteria bacterium]
MVGDRQSLGREGGLTAPRETQVLGCHRPRGRAIQYPLDGEVDAVVHRTMIGVYWMPAFAGMTPDGDVGSGFVE